MYDNIVCFSSNSVFIPVFRLRNMVLVGLLFYVIDSNDWGHIVLSMSVFICLVYIYLRVLMTLCLWLVWIFLESDTFLSIFCPPVTPVEPAIGSSGFLSKYIAKIPYNTTKWVYLNLSANLSNEIQQKYMCIHYIKETSFL